MSAGLVFLDKAGPIGALILVASVAAGFIVVERLWAFRRLRLRDRQLLARVRARAAQGDFGDAAALARNAAGYPIAAPLAHLLERLDSDASRSRAELEKTLIHAASREVRTLERFLPSLSLVANVTPLLGLMGTVTGMIAAFQAIENLGGKVNASVLAGGIWEAMLTTALGLGVAIPATIAHHFLQGRVQRLAADLQDEAGELLDLLENAGHVCSQAEERSVPLPKAVAR